MTLAIVAGLIIAVLGAIFWASRTGASAARAKAGRDAAEAMAEAAVKQLEMRDEGRKIGLDVEKLTEAELDAELKRWSPKK